jgi:hypothetical protein
MKILTTLLLFAVLHVAHQQPQHNWVAFFVTYGKEYWFDKSSIKHQKENTFVWIKIIPRSDSLYACRLSKYVEHGTDSRWMKYSHTMNKVEIDCGKDKLKFLNTIDYDEAGTPLEDEEYDEEKAHSSYIVPETMGDYLEKAVCK